MRAFLISEFGERGSVADRPKPEPDEGQLLVRVRAASVNAMDPIYRSGAYKDYMEHRLPITPGSDYAGTVEAIGPGVTGFSPGDEVFGDAGKSYVGEGSFGQYVTVAAGLAAKRPPNVPAEQAAALPRAAGTALVAVDTLDAAPGDTIAIIGAAGGVGSFATQLAANRGVRVIAVTRGEHADFVRGLGAAEVVDYTAGDVGEQLKARAPQGIAGIIDLYNDAPSAAALAAAVRAGGRIVSPVARGLEDALAGQAVTGHSIRGDAGRAPELADLAASGTITAQVEVLPLDAAADALDRQASRQVRGKLVLAID